MSRLGINREQDPPKRTVKCWWSLFPIIILAIKLKAVKIIEAYKLKMQRTFNIPSQLPKSGPIFLPLMNRQVEVFSRQRFTWNRNSALTASRLSRLKNMLTDTRASGAALPTLPHHSSRVQAEAEASQTLMVCANWQASVAMTDSSIATKQVQFFQPTQLLIHLQWWSNPSTHLLHCMQCLLEGLTLELQMMQRDADQIRSSSQSRQSSAGSTTQEREVVRTRVAAERQKRTARTREDPDSGWQGRRRREQVASLSTKRTMVAIWQALGNLVKPLDCWQVLPRVMLASVSIIQYSCARTTLLMQLAGLKL